MNLLMLTGDSTVACGIDGAFFQMLGRFSKYWTRIDIICPHAKGASERVIHGNVYVHPAPHHRLFQPFYIRKKGLALSKERRYDLISSHDFGFYYNGIGAYLLSRATRIPYVSDIPHIEGYPIASSLREKLYRLATRIYIPFAKRHASAFRAINKLEVPPFLMKMGVKAADILILYAFYIDFNVFHPYPEIEEKYDIAFVGRLATNKNIFQLLEAVRQVKAQKPDISLVMLGRGPLKKKIEVYIRTHDLSQNVTMMERLAHPEDVAKLYAASRMLVCSSTAEGGPRVTLEAMACKTAVITTPIGIMLEVTQDGVNGLLYQWDTEELASKIMRLLDQPVFRQELAEKGYESVQGFQADMIIRQYANGYHELIHRLRQKQLKKND
ncbi:glycosyltransferase family 4 protein [Anaerolineales bacterium]